MSAYDKARMAEEILKSAAAEGVSSHIQATLAGVIEEGLDPLLNDMIKNLHDKHQNGRSATIDQNLDTHRQILKFMSEKNYGDLKSSAITAFESNEQTRLDTLEIGRIESEKERLDYLLGVAQQYIVHQTPLIDRRRGKELLPDESTFPTVFHEHQVTALESRKGVADEINLYRYYFEAIMVTQLLGNEIASRSNALSTLRKNYTPLTPEQETSLELFKIDRHPEYCSIVYAAKYHVWRLETQSKMKLPPIDINININHT
jgi:hypothetical protein